ncbi:MAG: type II secretion system protein [Patescibacteria group bacterium]|nr:type II secretion system protein [Patescibacteria group bacterium]MDE2172386.1 type II secretion system protein [Patescibacteria group bacterium]
MMISRFRQSRQTTARAGGFTLVELMVTVAIFVFMTALVLWRYSSFSSGALLTNLAYDIGLSIHQAQTYGLSVRATDVGTAFGSAYGIDFRAQNANNFSNNVFTFFADGTGSANWNGLYDCSGNTTGSTCSNGDSIISVYNMKLGASIQSICVGDYNSPCNPVSSVDITFRRPDPAALIYSPQTGSATAYNVAEITVQSSDGNNTRTVTVNRAGQISVSN